jgi:Domain of unknown function (DUF6916)
MLENLSRSKFAENVNSAFQLRNTAGQLLELELIECHEGIVRSDYENFALLFKGPRDVVLSQRIYELEHPLLGTFALFLVPVKQDDKGTYYESVFNRLIRQEPQQK